MSNYSTVQRSIRSFICKYLSINQWHVEGIEEKEYAKKTVNRINMLIRLKMINKGLIVEIGCGLGDLIGNIETNGGKKEGYDIDDRIVFSARVLGLINRDGVKYIKGGFRDVVGKEIECLILMNWCHTVPPQILSEEVDFLMNNNSIKWIVMDEIRHDTAFYPYEHSCDSLFYRFGYRRMYNGNRIKAAGNAWRRVIVLRKQDEL